jgi:hypothetical protein
MRWYLILLVCLSLWLSGCLKRASWGGPGASSTQPPSAVTDSRSEALPTPQLFDMRLDLSTP